MSAACRSAWLWVAALTACKPKPRCCGGGTFLFFSRRDHYSVRVSSTARAPLTQAHRSHFYQRALVGGSSVSQIVGAWSAINVKCLAGFAAVTIFDNAPIVQITMWAAGCTLVGALFYTFDSAYLDIDERPRLTFLRRGIHHAKARFGHRIRRSCPSWRNSCHHT